MQDMNNLPVFYAQYCPDQPTIPRFNHSNYNSPKAYQNQIQDQLSQATRVVASKNFIKTSKVNQFKPKIIKGRRIPFHQSFQVMQRSRQNKSMANRIQNVKNMQQRKKDKFDAIVYPPYFVRNGAINSDVNIDGYMKKALNSTSWRQKQKQINKIYDTQKNQTSQQSRVKKEVRKFQYELSPKQSPPDRVQQQQNPESESQMPSPMFYRKQPAILKPVASSPAHTHISKLNKNGLPENDIRSILDHVYNHLLYKDQDFQALKSRMIHTYGKQQVKNTWRLAMQLLQRDI